MTVPDASLSAHFGSKLDWKDGLAAGWLLHTTVHAMTEDARGLEGTIEHLRESWVQFGPGLAALYTLSIAWFLFQIYARWEWNTWKVRFTKHELEEAERAVERERKGKH